jgi:mono/diheme cytochrome c family protein
MNSLAIVGWIGIVSIGSLQAESPSGQALFETHCTSCHATAHKEDESKLIAPYIMGTVRHVKEKFDTKEAAVRFMVDYIQNPSKEKAVCRPDAIKRFGLMPSLKGVISPEDLEKIAGYLYDTYPNGQGRGRGRGHGRDRGQGNGQGMHRGWGRGSGGHSVE